MNEKSVNATECYECGLYLRQIVDAYMRGTMSNDDMRQNFITLRLDKVMEISELLMGIAIENRRTFWGKGLNTND